jgi:hypothetical protein
MQATIDATSEVAAQAKCLIERHTERLLHLLSFVPDDKLTWAPSDSSRSALRLVAHCGLVSTFFAKVITETMPNPMPSPGEFFGDIGGKEMVTTREEATALAREGAVTICKALESVSGEGLDSPRNSPFGEFPLRFWVAQSTEHLAGHIGQLEYLQTVWGDLDNHFG